MAYNDPKQIHFFDVRGVHHHAYIVFVAVVTPDLAPNVSTDLVDDAPTMVNLVAENGNEHPLALHISVPHAHPSEQKAYSIHHTHERA